MEPFDRQMGWNVMLASWLLSDRLTPYALRRSSSVGADTVFFLSEDVEDEFLLPVAEEEVKVVEMKEAALFKNTIVSF